MKFKVPVSFTVHAHVIVTGPNIEAACAEVDSAPLPARDTWEYSLDSFQVYSHEAVTFCSECDCDCSCKKY